HSLDITRGTIRNEAVQATFASIIGGVSHGRPLADMLDESHMFPTMMINLVRTGEDTGELTAMLEEAAQIYEEEASRMVGNTVRLLEPIMIVFMGAIIAGIVAAVVLPIFQSTSAIQ